MQRSMRSEISWGASSGTLRSHAHSSSAKSMHHMHASPVLDHLHALLHSVGEHFLCEMLWCQVLLMLHPGPHLRFKGSS